MQRNEEVRLQKDAAARLNLLADELRNGPVNFAPREGKAILGDEGMAYIAESFAFNERYESWILGLRDRLGHACVGHMQGLMLTCQRSCELRSSGGQGYSGG